MPSQRPRRNAISGPSTSQLYTSRGTQYTDEELETHFRSTATPPFPSAVLSLRQHGAMPIESVSPMYNCNVEVDSQRPRNPPPSPQSSSPPGTPEERPSSPNLPLSPSLSPYSIYPNSPFGPFHEFDFNYTNSHNANSPAHDSYSPLSTPISTTRQNYPYYPAPPPNFRPSLSVRHGVHKRDNTSGTRPRRQRRHGEHRTRAPGSLQCSRNAPDFLIQDIMSGEPEPDCECRRWTWPSFSSTSHTWSSRVAAATRRHLMRETAGVSWEREQARQVDSLAESFRRQQIREDDAEETVMNAEETEAGAEQRDEDMHESKDQ
ncbi:uncharacterized protein K452DRAFT_316176 [Aplosporella prunicola CBS 121167]|uniref:Uncharacterized protein n=1 Tax=Aplosporella prunicola CBS 121167 TaxID=1176127 RepID=A0A6A6BQG6_9PEZI|nr:uncharacterized protein K452DRAFT_316176 [Aplosporella prunicola CBS 121167]KAF2145047.1 hypothetical protein K452DRAFT_316176 [Aplosporella prunicola CBS 121167]